MGLGGALFGIGSGGGPARTFVCLKQVLVANLVAAVVDCDPPLARVVHAVLPTVGEEGVPWPQVKVWTREPLRSDGAVGCPNCLLSDLVADAESSRVRIVS